MFKAQRYGVFNALGQRILIAKQKEQKVQHGEEVHKETERALTDIESLCSKELATLQEGARQLLLIQIASSSVPMQKIIVSS